jgi:murein DD-endopeptidase MepM/ murein hydrolase activator NlpD
MQKYFLFSLLLLCLFSCNNKKTVQEESVDECIRQYRFGIWIDSLDVVDFQVRQGESFSRIYADLGFSAVHSEKIVNAKADLFPPRSLRAGMNYHVFQTLDSVPEITHITFARSRRHFVVIDLQGDSVQVNEFEKPVTIHRRYAEGTIQSSLWNALAYRGDDTQLAINLLNIFAWQIDFTGLQRGDSYQILYDVAYINDTIPMGISSIEGAIFTHSNRTFYAFPFEQDSVRQFFDEEGNSLRRAFLKTPLESSYRITSGFSHARMHPILRIVRAHHGVDYAAPSGTPVITIGDGVIIERGYQAGGAGNFLRIRHNAVYTTTYMHLRGFAPGIQRGTHVKQGQVIGYVGATGLATGPHLDFRVHQNGVPINPLTMESPPEFPVHSELVDSFNVVKQNVLNEITRFSFDVMAADRKKNNNSNDMEE